MCGTIYSLLFFSIVASHLTNCLFCSDSAMLAVCTGWAKITGTNAGGLRKCKPHVFDTRKREKSFMNTNIEVITKEQPVMCDRDVQIRRI